MHRIKLPIKDYLKSNFTNPLGRIFPYILPYWRTYLCLFLFLFLNLSMTFAMTWFLKSITDAAIDKDFPLLKGLFILGIFLLGFSSLMTYFNSYVESMAIYKVQRDLKIALFHKTLCLRYDQMTKYHSGELLSRLTNDINCAAGLVGSNLLDLMRLPITFAAVFIYLASMNWKLSLVSLSLSPFLFLSGAFFGLMLKRNNGLLLENLSMTNRFFNDVFAGYPIVRSFSLERLLFRKYKEYINTQLSLQGREAKLSGGMGAGASLIGGIAYFLNLGFGAYLVAKGSLSVGSLLAFVSLMQYLVYPFMGLASCWSSFQRSVSAFERVWEVLDSPAAFYRLPAPLRSSAAALTIELRDLTFAYHHGTKVLEHVNFTIPAGKVTAIVGPSGAGKSTLFKLMLGLYKPDFGDIWFNHKSIQQLNQTELRSFMAYVPQETYLFDGTIRENLLHGYPEATKLELIKAAKDANIHDFIMSLPQRYDSEIGERGVRLSGGQKQRISIARALLKNAPLLLLDEATSALDQENEWIIQESLAKLMKDRTTLVIAHRLSTIQKADWIIVMDQGKVIAQGTHALLMARENLYSKMYGLQFKKLPR
jgi:ATP-binding cassette, subfamily B, bacterial